MEPISTNESPENDNSASQVYVITPNQLAKLGLSSQIHSIMATQVQPQQPPVESFQDEEQSLSVPSSIASELEEDEQVEKVEEKPQSKLMHLLNTNEIVSVPSPTQNAKPSVTKDANKVHILNYTASSPYHGIAHGVIKHKRSSDVTTENESRYQALATRSLSQDSGVKSAPRIINSKAFSAEALKACPLKLEIVSNEVVNFSPMEIQNILKHNPKAAESIPQSTSDTFTTNKTACLQSPPCPTQEGAVPSAAKVEKHFKKKLYETFHVADSAGAVDEISDEGEKVDGGSKPVEGDGVRLQSFKVNDNAKDRNSFRPPTKTFVVRQAQVQIRHSFEGECERAESPPKVTESVTLNVSEKKKETANNNNTEEAKLTEDNNSAQKHSSPTLLNSLLQNRNYVGAVAHIHIPDSTPTVLNFGGVGVVESEKRQRKAELESNDSEEVVTITIEGGTQVEVEEEQVTDEEEELNKKKEQEKKIEVKPAPRVLNLELQEKSKVFFESAALTPSRKENRVEERRATPTQHSKLQLDLLKKVNTLTAQSTSKTTKSTHGSSVLRQAHCKVVSVSENSNFTRGGFRCYGKNTLEVAKSSNELHRIEVDTPKFKYFRTIRKKVSDPKVEKVSSDEQDAQDEVIDLSAEEVATPKYTRSTRKEREEKRSTTRSPPSDADLYVQSKTSGRKRKYVDYKILSGIGKSDRVSSDSDESTSEEAPLKKFTVSIEEVSEGQPVKKRGRGRPRKQVVPDCSSSDLPNSRSDLPTRTEKDESTVESPSPLKTFRGRRGRSAGLKMDVSECVNTTGSEIEETLDLSSNSQLETATLVSSTPKVKSESAEKKLRSYRQILLEKMNSAENFLNSKSTEKGTARKQGLDLKSKKRGEPENESKSAVDVEKKRRGRSKKIQEDPKSSTSSEQTNSDASKESTRLEKEDTEIKRGRGRPRKIEVQTEDSNSQPSNQTDPEFDKEDIETKSGRRGRGRSRKMESTNNEKSPTRVSTTSDLDASETTPERKTRGHFKKAQKQQPEGSKSTSNNNNRVDQELNTEDDMELDETDVKNKSEGRGRGRPKKSQVEAGPSISNVKEEEERTESSVEIKPEKRGRGRPRTKNILKIESPIVVKRPRGRPPKQNKDDSLQEVETEVESNTARCATKKPRIAEVNLSEDRVNSDIDLNNTGLNSSVDPLDIDSLTDEQAEPSTSTSDSTKNSPERKTNIVEKRRRGRPKVVGKKRELESEIERDEINVNSNTAESQSSEKGESACETSATKQSESVGVVAETQQKRRGRKRKIIATEDKAQESSDVTCAVCNSVLEESQWLAHNEQKHNNLAWKTDDTPLDLNDQALVERILADLHKNKKVLHCEQCGCRIEELSDYAEHKSMCTEKTDSGESTEPPTPKKKIISTVLDSLFSNITKSEEPAEGAKEDAGDNSFVEEILPPMGTNDVRCAVCKDVMPKGQWPLHKQKKHNNLAWKVGDKPLDLSDRSLVMKILTALCKSKKALFCELCGVAKKLVLGYLSHKSQCQKTDSEINAMKVKCEICGRTMLPVSLQSHMVLSHSTTAPEAGAPPPTPDLESDTQGKRRAANKAAGLIHNFAKDMLNEVSSAKFKKYVKNVHFRSVEAAIFKFSEDIQKQTYTECVFDECDYRTSEHEDLFYHIENCDKNSDNNYTCNFCLATFRARQGVQDHIKLRHDGNEHRTLISQFSDEEFNSESEDDFENEYLLDSEFVKAEDDVLDLVDEPSAIRPRKAQQSLSTGKTHIHFLQSKSKKPRSIYRNAYWWMEKFCQENYNLSNTFPHGIFLFRKEDWKQLEAAQVVNYLPKLRHSVDTARIKLNSVVNPICYEYVWKRYKLFESENLSDDGDSIFFCGGPINALAWVPTPHTECNRDQILAVTVSPDPDIKYNTNATYKCEGLIQFWNVGTLDNKATSSFQPKLEFAIAHDHGVVWAMEWCPSGCYDLTVINSMRWLGLLAVACSNSFVYIYLVPHPGQMSGKVFKTKPVYQLQLENFTDLSVGEIDYYSTRLSWCKTEGHQFLAVGYSNGIVALYDLKTQASLLKTELDGVITLQPLQKFRAHLDAITALCLYHLHDGKRWLLTGSLDRDCKLWDLENVSEPINYCKKFVITDAVWLVHWLCSVYSFDHGCITGAVPTSLNPARDFLSSCTSFMPSNSRVTSITANEWANLFIQANDCGEVICGFPDQLLRGYDCDRKKSLRKSRCLASYTGTVPKSLSVAERVKLEGAKLEVLKNQHPGGGKGGKKKSADADLSETRTYFEAENKYGLVFCDLNMNCKSKEPTAELNKLLQSIHYFSLAKPDMYPLQSITKVTSNPNKQSFLYYASGYQVGVVRISNVRFLCPENEQNVLLR